MNTLGYAYYCILVRIQQTAIVGLESNQFESCESRCRPQLTTELREYNSKMLQLDD